MTGKYAVVALKLDKMKLTLGLEYDKTVDVILGFEDWEEHSLFRTAYDERSQFKL